MSATETLGVPSAVGKITCSQETTATVKHTPVPGLLGARAGSPVHLARQKPLCCLQNTYVNKLALLFQTAFGRNKKLTLLCNSPAVHHSQPRSGSQFPSCSSARVFDYSILRLETNEKCKERKSYNRIRTLTVNPGDASKYLHSAVSVLAAHTSSLDIKTSLNTLSLKQTLGSADTRGKSSASKEGCSRARAVSHPWAQHDAAQASFLPQEQGALPLLSLLGSTWQLHLRFLSILVLKRNDKSSLQGLISFFKKNIFINLVFDSPGH